MALNSEKVFGSEELDGYNRFDRLKIRLISLAFTSLIRLIGFTLRFEIENQDVTDGALSGGRQPIYCFWHDRIIPSTYFFRNRKIIVMTSRSFDGECIARTIVSLGYGASRGSSSRGGVGALIDMIKFMKAGYPCAFTVDGPRGPRYEAKSGPCLLAKKTGNPLIPFSVEVERFWTVGSWDRLQVPRPFSKAKLIYGNPIAVDPNATDDDIESVREELQSELLRLVEKGREWRERQN